jgi:N-acetylglucosaminyl-diphospho-decaprenol L-rhamnosyltransferase
MRVIGVAPGGSDVARRDAVARDDTRRAYQRPSADIVVGMPDGATLAVQVVNYRTRRYLERCIETVVSDLDAGGLAYEINVLDNASGEDLEDLAARYTGGRAFTTPVNLGFGGGHNLLAARTEAPYLLILNPDVEIVGPGTVARLLDLLLGGGGRVVVVGPKLVTADGCPQPYDHGRLHGARAAIALRGGHSYWRATGVRQEVAWVSGAAMLVERAAFAAIGGFDEQLFLYKEDEDLCLRLREAGGVVVYEPGVMVRHVGSVVTDHASDLAEASSYYFAKHFGDSRSRRAFAAAHQTLAYLRL